MSQEARQALVDDDRIVLTTAQREDILDQSAVNTWLVEFLGRLLETAGHPILVTSLFSDHEPGTYHNPDGRAVDVWHADWETAGDGAIVDVLAAAAAIGNEKPRLLEVGLSGSAAAYQDDIEWPFDTEVFVESYGQQNEHVHFAVGVPH